MQRSLLSIEKILLDVYLVLSIKLLSEGSVFFVCHLCDMSVNIETRELARTQSRDVALLLTIEADALVMHLLHSICQLAPSKVTPV